MTEPDDREADATRLPETKLTRTKQTWAREGRFLSGRRGMPDGRLPPGQHGVRDWPVLDLGLQPEVETGRWRLEVTGAVEHPVTWEWADFLGLPQQQYVTDIHCVTTWSRFDNRWQGVSTRVVLDQVQPRSGAGFVMLHAHDGYTTNLPLADFAAPDTLLAHAWEERPIAAEHGGPVRLVVPHLYFWKSAKWLRRIEFIEADEPGYWEQRGYHMRGDPWQEQRHSDD